jgi:cysteine desulfurase/selenocysteine lyase
MTMRECIHGIDAMVPLLSGRTIRYVNLDNAASTPPMKSVVRAISELAPFYSSVHRGTGFKSRLCTDAYDQAHEIIGEFVGADLRSNTVIFVKNATEAINKLSHRFVAQEGSFVVTTRMEHHSNDLPWRDHFDTLHVRIEPDGRLDEDHYDSILRDHAGRIALVAVTGASNVTGFILPIHRLAEKAHAAGARIMVDAAQLAPHRKIDMKPDDAPDHIDYLAIAGHKMYAPYGTGALIGPKKGFLDGAPDYCGGGTVDVVTPDEVYWAGMPDRDEAGSPNVMGAVAMAAAAKTLMEEGMDSVAEHERELTEYALTKLGGMGDIRIYGETDPARASEKVGVIPFNLEGTDHALLAAVAGFECGVGVRNGCFCAHPYVVELLHLRESEVSSWREQFLRGDKSRMPGMVRMSFGCYSNREDVDRLIEAIHMIRNRDYIGDYHQIPETGEFFPRGYTDDYTGYWMYPDGV